MREGDGYSPIRRVRALEAGRGAIPAIALSARARAEGRSRVLAAGSDAKVAKPVEFVEPKAVIASAAKQARRSR